MTSSPIPAARSQYLLGLLAQVPDPRKKRGRRHPLAGLLAVGIAAVVAGSRSFAAIGQWAADAGPEVLAGLGAARGPAEESTFRRAFALVSPDVLDRVLGAWLHTRAVQAGGRLVIAIDGKSVRGAKDTAGKAPHLVAALAHGIGAVLGQVAVDAKSNEIPAVRELLKAFASLASAVITIDAMHTQSDTAQVITGQQADYVMTVEHASHCSCCWSWRVKESSLAVSGLDTEPFAASLGEVDGGEFAALDLVQHGLAGDAEAGGGLAEGQPAVGGLGPDPVAELLVDADLPGRSGGELLAGDEVSLMNAPDNGADAGHAADAGAGHDLSDQARLRRLADEQAALRRVATLVASGARPTEVFTAVADELGHLIGAEATFVSRIDHPAWKRGELERYATVVGSYGRVSDQVPVGFQLKLLPGMVHTTALRTGRPARINGERLAMGPYGAWVGSLGMRAGVATPIVVGGRRWGVMVAATSREDFQPDTESRMADFMELAAMAIANAEAEQQLRKLAQTQAALRRLATLVARGESPEAVFAAATREALRYFGSGTARMIRYEPDGTPTLVANEGMTGPHVRIGERWEGYPPDGLTATVLRTGQAARVDDYRDVPGGEPYLREGLRSAVAMPVHVDGRLWGAIAVGSGEGPLPPDTEQRMTEFTDLVATAVANAQNRAALEASRDELARLLEEQAALRRVATLVAHGIDPAKIFSAVAEEIRRLLDADTASISRFEPDGKSVVVVGGGGDVPMKLPVGTRVELLDYVAPSVVWQTGRAAQVDEDVWSSLSDPFARALRELGFRSMVASPIIVDGRLWGVVNAVTRREAFPAGTADRMADFTELVATAVGNAQSRAELAASRARIVAAADQARRRIERDLHDGTQQRLVSLGLGLRLAQSMVPVGLPELETEIGRVADELTSVVEDLREIARGIHPAILSEGGLGPALHTLARRAAIAVELDVAAIGRLPEPVEVAAYYVVSEALTNATRHAHASVAEVGAAASGGTLRVRVRDDGAGGADPVRGSGLVGLPDRIEALGGTFSVHSLPGRGTTVSCELPVLTSAGQPDADPGQ